MSTLLKLINPIKDAMVQKLKDNMSTLGIKTVAKDITLDRIADEIDSLVASFPAVIVVYYGRRGRVVGTNLELTLTFALIVATRSVQAPNAAEPIAADLLDPLLGLFHGFNLAPEQQRGYFTFTDEALEHKDKVFSIYRQLYDTDVVFGFRTALERPSN